MKRFLAPILLLTLLFPSIALGETMKDLVVRDGIYYKKFSDVPFTGKTTGETQGTFRNGKLDGPYAAYYDKGQLLEKGTYKDGKLDGPFVTYYENGQLFRKETYEDGKRDGPAVTYHADGTVDEQFSGTFKDGVKVK